jgi:hypothetical protein
MTTLQAAPATTSSRQRVLDTLAHKQPDQVPVDFGATSVTGIHVSCVAALRDYHSTRRTRSEKESLSEGCDVMQGGKVDRLAVRFQDEGPDAGGNRTVIGKREY